MNKQPNIKQEVALQMFNYPLMSQTYTSKLYTNNLKTTYQSTYLYAYKEITSSTHDASCHNLRATLCASLSNECARNRHITVYFVYYSLD